MIAGWGCEGTLPDCDGARCVHALGTVAQCRACVDACPRAAWLFTEEGLGLDTDACNGCGLCVPACPQAAISLPRVPACRAGDGGDVIFAICREIAQPGDDGVLPCLHSLGLRDLSRAHGMGVRELVVAEAQCDSCTCGGAPRLQAAVEDFAKLARDRGDGGISLRTLDAEDWRRALRATHMPGGLPRMNRRDLLSMLVPRPREEKEPAGGQVATPSGDPAMLHLHVPEILAGECSGCDACLRICPQGALRLSRDDGGRLSYVVHAELCTGCGLCRDICETDAVRLHRLARPTAGRIPLIEARCRSCGAPFHLPEGARADRGLCRICTGTSHRRKLFQVQP